MDFIEQLWVSLLLRGDFQVIHIVPMEAHMVSNNTRKFIGEVMFLSTILLKLSGAVNGHF